MTFGPAGGNAVLFCFFLVEGSLQSMLRKTVRLRQNFHLLGWTFDQTKANHAY